MPGKAKTLCRGGCCRAVVGGYCDACKAKGATRDERRSSAARGYGYRWQRYRRAYLEAHPLCVDPRHGEVVVLAADVDHIEAVSGPNDPLFWVESNHQSLCHEHHSEKTATENGGFGNARKNAGAGMGGYGGQKNY
jgi:5-methylcytosine-specific restriction enzyme A